MEAGRPAIILCGGRGTRISDVDPRLPKPMLPIGPQPVVWHIMKIYAHHGVTDFTLAVGWLGEELRRWTLEQEALHPDSGWQVSCLDTGVDALTGTRVRMAARLLDDGPVLVTYGDGLADVDVTALLAFHRSHGRLATVTAVRPASRFGELVLDGDVVTSFAEKPPHSGPPINGGFMVFEREALLRYIPADEDVMLEREPMAALARDGQLMAWQHGGFWQPMDTAGERAALEALWNRGDAPWKVWDDAGAPLGG